jgi:hypothetical protein
MDNKEMKEKLNRILAIIEEIDGIEGHMELAFKTMFTVVVCFADDNPSRKSAIIGVVDRAHTVLVDAVEHPERYLQQPSAEAKAQ